MAISWKIIEPSQSGKSLTGSLLLYADLFFGLARFSHIEPEKRRSSFSREFIGLATATATTN